MSCSVLCDVTDLELVTVCCVEGLIEGSIVFQAKFFEVRSAKDSQAMAVQTHKYELKWPNRLTVPTLTFNNYLLSIRRITPIPSLNRHL